MEAYEKFEAVALPLEQANVDTDQILPARYLQKPRSAPFGEFLFRDLRFLKDGGENPRFVLNQDAYKHGSVLVAGPDFGTGSSREHAVWALKDYGFKVVLASRFADIFRGNSGKQGLLTGIVSQENIELLWKLLETEPGKEITVSLEDRTVTCGELTVPFEIDDYVRWRLMEGLDDIGLTLQDEAAITAFEAKRESWRPKTLPEKTEPKQVIEAARPA